MGAYTEWIGRRLVLLGLVGLVAAWSPSAAQALNFTSPPGSPFAVGGTTSWEVAVGDFDGDSHRDLAIANNDSDNVSVLVGDGTGSFAWAGGSPFPAGDGPRSVAVGDFNGDADPDLAVANFNSNDVSVLLGGPGASFATAAGSPYLAGSGPGSVAVGDFNGDSDPDLAVSNSISGGVSVLLGGAGASFAAAPGSPFPTGVDPRSIAVGDVNGDSDPDLAVAGFIENDVSVLLGDGTGGFVSATGSPFPVSGSGFANSVAVADFNADTYVDLAVTRPSAGSVSVLRGNASGSFPEDPASPFPTGGSGSQSVRLAEFNGDSDPDLVVANPDSHNVSVLLGGAGASFAPAAGSPFALEASYHPYSVAVADLTGDGDLDLVTSNPEGNVSVLLGVQGYARPAGATPLRVPLVPAYLECRGPNRTHGAPLDSPSCNPPAQLSPYLTVGTPDANGNPANSVGFARLSVARGDAGTTADEADVALQVSVTDVRNTHDLSDYTGELGASINLRITDKDRGGEEATLTDTDFRFAVPCTATGGTEGGICSVSTSADTIAPGVVKELNRAIWQLGQVKLLDGGEDGLASTTDDDAIFVKQGVFVP